jgi:phosphoribosylformimino-5-aminoimidazole carboxamide ribotide isomerase
LSRLEIIPVIDLGQGEVLHARRGQRSEYKPLRSILCEGSAPAAVVEGLLGLHPFTTLYAADLDSIRAMGSNDAALTLLRRRFPAIGFWVDAGLSGPEACLDWLERDLGDLVLGSEAQRDVATLSFLMRRPAAASRTVLSLDFAGDRFLGPPELLEPRLWPSRVIVMTLARVGSGEGPDLQRLAPLLGRAGGRQVYAAGGVRDAGDLKALAAAGAAGVLIASALHDGRIGREELVHL